MTNFSPAAILDVLARHNVAYVLIGGYAALLQGSGLATIDIDIVPEKTANNLANLAAALKDLDARIRVAGIDDGLPFSASAESLQGVSILNLTTRFGDLDLAFSPAGFAAGFPSLREGAIDMKIEGLTVHVASLDDVIASKEAAGRDKDFEALPTLIRLRREQQVRGPTDEQ
jgi:ABC-type amino acid transport substrate-binding protein